MTTLSPLTADDHDDWLSLWWGYLEFYETELSTELTELAFARLTGAMDAVHGAIARDDEGRGIGLVHWLTHPSTWSVGPTATSRTSSCTKGRGGAESARR